MEGKRKVGNRREAKNKTGKGSKIKETGGMDEGREEGEMERRT